MKIFYNRLLLTIAVTALFFLNAGACRPDERPAYANDYASANCGNKKEHGIFSNGNNGWEKALSKEQKKEINLYRTQVRKQMNALNNKIAFEKLMLKKVVTSGNPDEAAIERLTSRVAELKKEKLKLKYESMVKVRGILTQEQKAKFDVALLRPAACANKRHE